MSQNNQSAGGVGWVLSTLWTLQVVFAVLKMTSLVTWSWWAVLVPLYVTAGLILAALVLYALVSAAGGTVTKPEFANPSGLRGRQ